MRIERDLSQRALPDTNSSPLWSDFRASTGVETAVRRIASLQKAQGASEGLVDHAGNPFHMKSLTNTAEPLQLAVARLSENEFQLRMADGIADAAWEEFFSRDALAGIPPEKGKQQSLHAYDIAGNTSNPAEGEQGERLKEQVKRLCRDAIGDMPQLERINFSMVFPKLVRALALDRRYLSGIRDQGMDDIFKTAYIMFKHPEHIKRHHIRQGEGGNETLNGRGPGYMTSALEVLRRVNTVFTNHGNWALHHHLHDTIEKGEGTAGSWLETQKLLRGEKYKKSGEAYTSGDYFNEWLGSQLQETAKNYMPEASWKKLSPQQFLNEVDQPKYLHPKVIKAVLETAWVRVTGKPADIDQLQKEYHFTYDTPTLVIFNASHAAININGMDPERTLGTRDVSQALKRAFIKRYYPDLVDSVVFQNDKDWSAHTPRTRLQLRYLYNRTQMMDGLREEKDATLLGFRENHKTEGSPDYIDGIPTHIYYALNHPPFFGDKSMATEGADRFYVEGIMEETDTTGQVNMHDMLTLMFHQGKPEATFDYYRTIISEIASLPDYEVWLEQEQNAIMYDYATIAKQITDLALQNMRSATGWTGRDFQAYLAQADRATKKPTRDGFFQQHIQSSAMTSEKPQEGDSSEVERQKILAANKKQKKYWENLLQQLVTKKPQNEEEKQAILEALANERTYVQNRLELLRGLKRTFDDRLQREDYTKATELATDPDIQVQVLPGAQTKFITTGMKQAAYYPVEGADSLVHPVLEPVALANYDQRISQLKRIKGTTNLVIKRLTSMGSEYGATEVELGIAKGNDIQETVQSIILEADRKEAHGDSDVLSYIETSLQKITQHHYKQTFMDSQGMNGKKELGTTLLYNATVLEETVLSKLNGQIDIAEAVRNDYLMVLSAINPTLIPTLETGKVPKNLMGEVAKAEADYNAFLEEFFASLPPPPEPNGHKTDEMVPTVLYTREPAAA